MGSPLTFGSILKDIILPAAGGIVPAVLANRAQAGGLNQAQGNLEDAYNRAQGSIAGAVNAAKPIADWQYQQQKPLNDWAYQNALANQGWGFGASQQAKASGLNNAFNVMNQGFNTSQSMLSPYSQLGNNALAALQSHVFGGPKQTPQQFQTPQFQMPQLGMIAPPRQMPVPGMGGNTLATGGAALPPWNPQGSAGPGGGTGNLQNTLAMQGVSGPGIGSTLGGVGGSVAGGLIGSGAGALPGIGLGAAVGGPIGAAVGALISPLVGRLTRRGREKEAASSAANDYGTWVEDLYRQYKAGTVNAQTFEAAVKSGWAEYGNWLRTHLKDDFVVNNSLTDQAKWVNQSMKQKGFNFTV